MPRTSQRHRRASSWQSRRLRSRRLIHRSQSLPHQREAEPSRDNPRPISER